LKDALSALDRSFLLALAGHEDEARQLYETHWGEYRKQVQVEHEHITIFPEEPLLVDELDDRTARFREAGDRFFRAPKDARGAIYFGGGQPGLRRLYGEVNHTAEAILKLNQNNMEAANEAAQRTARRSLLLFGGGLVVGSLLAAFLAYRLVRAILRPIEAVTRAAPAIGEGQLDRVVPLLGNDELGQLAQAFNTLPRHLPA